MDQKCSWTLNNYILWNSKGKWLFTSKKNYLAENIDVSLVEDFGTDYNIALLRIIDKYGFNVFNDTCIMNGNTPQV